VLPSFTPPRCAPDTPPYRLSANLGEKMNHVVGSALRGARSKIWNLRFEIAYPRTRIEDLKFAI
jgi:hypothetical protein